MADKKLTSKDFETATIYKSGLLAKAQEYGKVVMSAGALALLGLVPNAAEAGSGLDYSINVNHLIRTSATALQYWLGDGDGQSSVTKQQWADANENMTTSFDELSEYITEMSAGNNQYQNTVNKLYREKEVLQKQVKPASDVEIRQAAIKELINDSENAPFLLNLYQTNPKMFEKEYLEPMMAVKRVANSSTAQEVAAKKLEKVEAEITRLSKDGNLSSELIELSESAPFVVAGFMETKANVENAVYSTTLNNQLRRSGSVNQAAAVYSNFISAQAQAYGLAKGAVDAYNLKLAAEKEGHDNLGKSIINSLAGTVGVGGHVYSSDYPSGSNGVYHILSGRTGFNFGKLAQAIQGYDVSDTEKQAIGVAACYAHATVSACEKLYKLYGLETTGVKLNRLAKPTKQTENYIKSKMVMAANKFNQTGSIADQEAMAKLELVAKLREFTAGAQEILRAGVIQSIASKEQADKLSDAAWWALLPDAFEVEQATAGYTYTRDR